MTDKGKYADFGFIEFKTVECVLRCIRLLNNYKIDD